MALKKAAPDPDSAVLCTAARLWSLVLVAATSTTAVAAAATATAVATAATAAVAATAATASVFARTSLTDGQVTATKAGAVQRLDCLRSVFVGHLDEAEAPGTSRFAVGRQRARDHLAILAEQSLYIFLRGGVGQIPYINSL